jgi:hypothetical protein
MTEGSEKQEFAFYPIERRVARLLKALGGVSGCAALKRDDLGGEIG